MRTLSGSRHPSLPSKGTGEYYPLRCPGVQDFLLSGVLEGTQESGRISQGKTEVEGFTCNVSRRVEK